MRSSRKVVSRIVARKHEKKKNRRRITAISLMIILAVISLTITPAITMRGNPEDVSQPLKTLQQAGTSFSRVTSEKDFDGSSCYLIVSPNENQALSYDTKYGNKSHVAIEPLIYNDNSYDIRDHNGGNLHDEKVGNNLKWNIIYENGMAQIQSVYDGRYYLNFEESSIWSQNPQNLKLVYNEASGLWNIAHNIENNSSHLVLDENMIKKSNNAENKNAGWMIFKLSKETIKGNQAPNGSNKLSAPLGNTMAYIQPSGLQKGSYLQNGTTWSYASDAATSKIEALYNGNSTDDGKVLADKSVIYGKDDYNAFNNYGVGTFGVTLSALAQQYNLHHGETADIPVDVVFVLDTSGSMKANNAGPVTRAEAMVNAVNPAMKEIMTLNANNRVGIVNFSDGSAVYLGLDRYTTYNATNKYLQYVNGEIVTASEGVVNSKGQTIVASTAVTNGTLLNWSGTYTQSGIARANEMLQANKDTTYTDSQGYTVKRKPIVILLSDGEPTYCTNNYNNVLSGPNYGSGHAYLDTTNNTTNNKGIHGYYTILSANYYRQQIANHYGTKSGFYTIGMGIEANGIGSPNVNFPTGDDYKRAVLNPTLSNIEEMYNNRYVYSSEETGVQLWNLLNNNTAEYSSGYISVWSEYRASLGGQTYADVPIIKNPYETGSYSYADNAFFGTMSEEELKAVFESIIRDSIEKIEYGFALQKNTAVSMIDPIGIGMEVKGVPVLRYNGTNYECTSHTEDASSGVMIKTYTYGHTATDTNTGRTVNLDKIIVRVIKDNSGNETVTMDVPDACMPVYALNENDGSYYEELPVRLIYPVGLTDTALATKKPGDIFYTNRWNGESASATLSPMDNNPYYSTGGGYFDNSVNKSENTTATSNISSSSIKNNNKVTISLGNNGCLTVGEEKTNISLSVMKKWQEANGTDIADVSKMPEVIVSLYRRTNLSGAVPEYVDQIKLNNSNSWKYDFTALPYMDAGGNNYIYYVKENPVDGYIGTVSGEVTMSNGTIIITNKKVSKNGSIAVKKNWQNYFGQPIQDTSLLPEIKAELWRHVTYTEPDAATLTIVCSSNKGDTTKQVKVARGSNVTFYVRAMYDSEWENYVKIYKDNMPTDDVAGGGYRDTRLQTITVNNDMTVRYRSVSSYEYIYANSMEVINLQYKQPGVGGTHTAPDELYKSTTLNYNNNWQNLWENLPTTEIKNGNTYTYKYYVKEISNIPGYTTTYSPENTTGVQGGTLNIINKSNTAMDVLPETGGQGTRFYLIGGMLMILLATIALIYKKMFSGGGKPFS